MNGHLSFGLSSSVATTETECQAEDRAGEQERGLEGRREEGKLEMEEPIFLRDGGELSSVIASSFIECLLGTRYGARL